jgi:sugar (pentulose or hexulose) kinase
MIRRWDVSCGRLLVDSNEREVAGLVMAGGLAMAWLWTVWVVLQYLTRPYSPPPSSHHFHSHADDLRLQNLHASPPTTQQLTPIRHRIQYYAGAKLPLL